MKSGGYGSNCLGKIQQDLNEACLPDFGTVVETLYSRDLKLIFILSLQSTPRLFLELAAVVRT
jgi:hypothetical protein